VAFLRAELSSALPANMICLSASADNQTAKQTVMPDGEERGVFTHNVITYLQSHPSATFAELRNAVTTKVKRFQNIVLSSSEQRLAAEPVIPPETSVPPSRHGLYCRRGGSAVRASPLLPFPAFVEVGRALWRWLVQQQAT